ncbi:hypothetical protein BGX20_004358, partial [Mortierella sp. AD010]
RFSELLIDFISETPVEVDIIQHEAFKKIISYAHPHLKVQDWETLCQFMERNTIENRGRPMEELHRHCPNGSLTADS